MPRDLDPPAGPTWLHRWEARWKLGGFLLLIVAVAVERPEMRFAPTVAADVIPAAGCLALAAVLVGTARFPLRSVLRKLRPVAYLLLLLFLIFPFAYDRGDTVALGPIEISTTGLLVAAVISLRAIAIVLLGIAAFGTTRFDVGLEAFRSLRVPRPLVEAAHFAHRYARVQGEQLRRMRLAMRCRGFVPRLDAKTLRALGNAVGMLLVSSTERVQRISCAMRARGYHGDGRPLRAVATCGADVARFAGFAALAATLVLWRLA